MSDKITQKDITQKIKLHLKMVQILHNLALLNKDLEKAEFEQKVKDFIGERDFYYIKDFKN